MNDQRSAFAGSKRKTIPKAPLVGVGVIVKRGKEFVLIKRRKEPAKGMWTIPGGHVEFGESLEEAARREIREECSLEIGRLEPIHVFDIIDKEGDKVRRHLVVIDYYADYAGGILTAGDDAEAAGWFTIEDLDSLPCPPNLRKVIQKALAE
ncbi:MAG: NUDIX hydrolase [candidate division KSB1 bacterium]|nr:NUDIX hydrolase [candidate division KSB1 bacterium]